MRCCPEEPGDKVTRGEGLPQGLSSKQRRQASARLAQISQLWEGGPLDVRLWDRGQQRFSALRGVGSLKVFLQLLGA